MYQVPQITDSVYYVGVNDRMKERFENVWSIPSGVAYNAYLIVDEKTTLIDTVDVCYSDPQARPQPAGASRGLSDHQPHGA